MRKKNITNEKKNAAPVVSAAEANKGKKHVKYYSLSEMTPDEIMEDYFATEEEDEDLEFHEVGTYDPNNPEERDAVFNKLMDEIANEPEFTEQGNDEKPENS